MAGINMAQLTGTSSAKASSTAKTSGAASSRETSRTDFASMIQGKVKENTTEEPGSSKPAKGQEASADKTDKTDKTTGSAGQTAGKQEAAEKPGKTEDKETAGNLAEIQAALSQMMVQNLGTTEDLAEQLTASVEQLTASVEQLQAIAQGKVLESVQEAAAGSQEEEPVQVAVDQKAMADELTGSLQNYASVTAGSESVRTAAEDTEAKPVQAVETLTAQAQQIVPGGEIQKLAAETSGDSHRQETSERGNQSQEGPVSIQELMASSMTRSTSPESFASVEMPREETITVPTTPETFPQDVGNKLAASLPRTDGTLTIELEPAALGKMTIKVVYEAGRAAVSIMSANPRTVELLSQNASEIARILEERTGQITQVYTPDPRQSLEDGQAGQERQQHQQENPEKEKHDQTESFTQMLRLGLV